MQKEKGMVHEMGFGGFTQKKQGERENNTNGEEEHGDHRAQIQ